MQLFFGAKAGHVCDLFFPDGIDRTNYKAHDNLFKYRMQALNNIWKARKTAKIIMDEITNERSKRSSDGDPGRDPQTSTQPVNVASELTLLMLFPLIESQAKLDPSLRSRIIQLLMEFFAKATPMSIKGPKGQLDTVEDLLIQWAQQDDQAVQCLVALGCARDSVETLIKIIHLLMMKEKTIEPSISRMIDTVLKMDYEGQQAHVLDVHYHIKGFHYNAKYVLFYLF